MWKKTRTNFDENTNRMVFFFKSQEKNQVTEVNLRKLKVSVQLKNYIPYIFDSDLVELMQLIIIKG